MENRGYFINNIYYEDNIINGTIFQKCANKGIDLPCFCYHESLSIAGNCRMCLVEVSNNVKLVVSCAMPVVDNIKIYTNTKRIKKARESVLEFLLINHPLDCPICDQGGECDLQDITLVFGSDKGRYYEYNKRAIFDRDCGPLIKMLMTRCIHCTRCIRYLNEISVTNDFGMFGRGEDSEIGTYIKNSLIDELSGNIIDLCPVGALTSKPYSFTARPWELNNIESIDVLDSLASNIRVDFLNNKIYRILPIYNKVLNEDWITNKVRFFYDSNNNQRLINPMLKVDDKFIIIQWNKLFYLFIYELFKKIHNNVFAIYGMYVDFELVVNMNNFFNLIGTEVYIDNFYNKFDFRNQYIIEKVINIFENINNFLFVNINLRVEFPILNFKLKKLIFNNDMINIFSFGMSSSYYNIPIKFFGNSLNDFIFMLKGRNKINLELFFDNKIINSLFFVNIKFVNLKIFIKFLFNKIIYNLFGYIQFWLYNYFYGNINVINDNIGYINIFEQNNFKCISDLKNILLKDSFIFLENVDDYYFLSLNINKFNYIVYHGFFFDYGAKISNLLIPSLSNFEYDGIFYNIEGKLKKSKKIIYKNCITNSEFFIILKLYLKIFKFKFSIIKNFNKIFNCFNFLKIDFKKIMYKKNLILNNNKNFFFNKFSFNKNVFFNNNIFNYYKNDVYSFNSKNLHMASLDYLIKLKIFI